MMSHSGYKETLITESDALPGRTHPIQVPEKHFVNGRTMVGDDGSLDCPSGFERALFGLGCFWGAERKFWEREGVYLTAVGYTAGFTPNPEYEEVCSGQTGHSEVVAVVFDPDVVSYDELLVLFWESHDPTQGMRQGNDRGTQYRSGIYTYSDEQAMAVKQSLSHYQGKLTAAGRSTITTEVLPAPAFYFAEAYHQQYLAKNPGGYCGLGGTGVTYS